MTFSFIVLFNLFENLSMSSNIISVSILIFLDKRYLTIGELLTYLRSKQIIKT